MTATLTAVSQDDRTAALDAAVMNANRSGWRTISRTNTQAQLVKGKAHSHILHLILTLLTAGLWLLVWIPLAIFGGEKTRLLTVDASGLVTG